jgi:Sigma-70 region 2
MHFPLQVQGTPHNPRGTTPSITRPLRPQHLEPSFRLAELRALGILGTLSDMPHAFDHRMGSRNPNDAEEALQETFLRAYLAIKTFEGKSQIYTWLTRIAVNSALMILRKQRVCPEVLFDPQIG